MNPTEAKEVRKELSEGLLKKLFVDGERRKSKVADWLTS